MKEEYSEMRFIYPYYNSFLGKECLRITTTTSDGHVWFGVGEAIRNYLDENGLQIQQVEWKIQPTVDITKAEYIPIRVKSIDDFEKQFYSLNVEWENI